MSTSVQSSGPKLLGFTKLSVVTIKEGFTLFLEKIVLLLYG